MENATGTAPRRQLSILAIMIVAVATPATLALSYYQITGDPSFRPLALSVERLVAGGIEVEHIDVQCVILTKGTEASLRAGRQLGQSIGAALYGKGLESHVTLAPNAGQTSTQIFFIVDGNRFGPFSPGNVPHGIRIAADAAGIARRDAEHSPEHSW